MLVTYRFRLARVPDVIRELSISFESTWEVISQVIATGFADTMSGNLRFLSAVAATNSEDISEKITKSGAFWVAVSKWDDTEGIEFMVYDDSPVDIELQLLDTQSVVVKVATPFMGPFEDLVATVCHNYCYLMPHMIEHFIAVRNGRAIDTTFSTTAQIWDWYIANLATNTPARLIIFVPNFVKIKVSISDAQKIAIFIPKDCTMSVLKMILLETVRQMTGIQNEIGSIYVRSGCAEEELISTRQLTDLIGLSTSWLEVKLIRAGSVPERVISMKSTPLPAARDGPAYDVRFCLYHDRSKYVTAQLVQGPSMDELKSFVAALCTDLTGEDIKHFVLLDRDGDEFSSELDSIPKFWRILLKYFKDNSNPEFMLNIVLRERPDSIIKPQFNAHISSVNHTVPVEILPSTTTPNSMLSVSLAADNAVCKLPTLAHMDLSDVSEHTSEQMGLSRSDSVENIASRDMSADSPVPTSSVNVSNTKSVPVNSALMPEWAEQDKNVGSNEEAEMCAVYLKLASDMPNSIMTSQISEPRQNNQDAGVNSVAINIPYECSWDSILLSICKVIACAPQEISYLVPIIDGKIAEHPSGADLFVAESIQFWDIMKQGGSIRDSILWEVHGSKKIATSNPVEADSPSVQRKIAVNVALATVPQIVKTALIPLCAQWEDLVKIVCGTLGINQDRHEVKHIIVFDDDGDQLTTEISSSSKFWKISAFDSTVMRVYVSDMAISSTPSVHLELNSKPERKKLLPVSARWNNNNTAAGRGIRSGGSTEISVTIAHARHPRKEVGVTLRLNSSWSSISSACSSALRLDPELSIAYILAFDRSDRKFGSPLASSDRFWKNISYYSHHVLRVFTVATMARDSFVVSKNIPTYKAALASEASIYKTISYNAIPTMDDIRKSVSAHFKICADIITHVVFFGADGKEISGALNADSALVKYFHRKDVILRVFTSVPAVPILPRFQFTVDVVNGPPIDGENAITTSRNPSWEELSLELVEIMRLERVEQIDHVVFADEEGDEISGNISSDIKMTKFINSSSDEQYFRLRVYLNTKEISENEEAFVRFIGEENIEELDKIVDSKLNIDMLNPKTEQTAFLTCCEFGKIESVKWLLINKADMNQKSAGGSTGLHLAIMNGHNELVDYLISMGISIVEPDDTYLTPFLLACSVGNFHAAQLLLRRGAKISETQRFTGYHGIHLATTASNIKMIKFLIDNGVSIDVTDCHGMTPFLMTCSAGQLEVSSWLVERGCNKLATSNSDGEDGGSTGLHFACKGGHMAMVSFLLTLGLPIDMLDARGVSIVEKAKLFGHIDIANLILDREMSNAGPLDVAVFFRLLDLKEISRAQSYIESFLKRIGLKCKEEDMNLLFHLSCACGHVYLTEYFVVVGCNVNSPLGVVEATPLMQASKYGQLDVVKFLVDHGANMLARDCSDLTAMRIACLNGHNEIASFLEDEIKARKMAEIAKTEGDILPKAPPIETSKFGMIFACISGMDINPSVSQLFLPPLDDDVEIAHDSEVEDVESSEDPPEYLDAETTSVKLSGSRFSPAVYPLHSACRAGSSLGLISLLCDYMKDALDTVDDVGYSSLYISCALGKWDIAVCLIEHGANATLFCNAAGETPLHIICQHNVRHVLKTVLQSRVQRKGLKNVNINEVLDENQNSLLHVAAMGGATEVACMLIDETEIKLNKVAFKGRTALHLACHYMHPETALALINRGADVFVHDSVGASPLIYAVSANEIDVVKALIAKGSDVNDETKTGNTAMHIVCQTGNLEMAVFLHSHAGSLSALNEQGQSPYSYAEKFGHVDIMRWISKVDEMETLDTA